MHASEVAWVFNRLCRLKAHSPEVVVVYVLRSVASCQGGNE